MDNIAHLFDSLSINDHHNHLHKYIHSLNATLDKIVIAQAALDATLVKINKAQSKLDNTLLKINTQKGAMCSISGNAYEHNVHSVVKDCFIHDERLNTQSASDLAGSSSKNDLVCHYKSIDFGVEVKKAKTPDWMQCSIKFCHDSHSWTPTNGKIPHECRHIFKTLINSLDLFGGEIPPFMKKPLTHDEWSYIKSSTNKWNDSYIDSPSDTIRNLYAAKGCKYIQISDGYGLYHLGHDSCSFGVPVFQLKQRLRIRTKVHSRSNKHGHCNLSVTVACQPFDISHIQPSPFSLDNSNKLPDNICYLPQNHDL